LGQGDFVLTEAIVLGYPPIPMTVTPHLVAARAEVNAQVDIRGQQHVHFILSAMPRGGFSGGLAIAEYGFALGVITSSLLTNHKDSELGFFAVLTVEPIYNCLAAHKLLPQCQAEGWDDFWNDDVEYFEHRPNHEDVSSFHVVASLGTFDDGKRFYLEVSCDDDILFFATMLARCRDAIGPLTLREEEVREGFVKLYIEGDADDCRAKLAETRRLARRLLSDAGYRNSQADSHTSS
jgi:hypothetical protein